MALQVNSGINQVNTRRFLEYLVSRNILKPGFVGLLSNKTMTEIDTYLVDKKLADRETLLSEYAKFYGLPLVHLTNRPIDPNVASLLPPDVARDYSAVAYAAQGNNLYLAIGDPAKLQQGAPKALAVIRQQKGFQIHLSIAPEEEIQAIIDKLYNKSDATVPKPTVVKSLNKKDLINEVEPRTKQIDLRGKTISLPVLSRLPKEVAEKYNIVVFDAQTQKSELEPALIKLAAINPDDQHVKEIIAYIEQRNKVLVDRYQTDQASIDAALAQYPQSTKETVEPEPETETKPKTDEKTVYTGLAATNPIATPTTLSDKALLEPSQIVAEKNRGEAIEVPAGEISFKQDQPTTRSTSVITGNEPVSLDDQNLDALLDKPVNSVQDLADVFRGGVIPQIVAGTLFLGVAMKASDVHVEAGAETIRIRFRIDGILHDIIRVPSVLHAPLVSRIKILSKMKIDEQRVPQDGRFDVIISQKQVDVRVSTMPTVHGEKVVMRLLDKNEGIKSLEQLGVTGANFDTLIKNIDKPYGVVLATGPTGSGKSTTLYAVLSRLSKPGVNIITLEDPVEYELPGINQTQVKPQIGFTFAEGLRSVLRQDPNIIMVGEIRDLETAAMVTHSALTGHLVLTTLHTNDASGALPRLVNMGVEPYLITSSLNCVIAQRLVRKICDDCREQIEIPPAVKDFVRQTLSEAPSGQLTDLNPEQMVFYHGRGCPNCTNGYRGRIGIFEVLPMSEKIEDLAVRKSPASEIKKQAIAEGMMTMIQDGLVKALKGITSVDEVMRVTTTAIKEDIGS